MTTDISFVSNMAELSEASYATFIDTTSKAQIITDLLKPKLNMAFSQTQAETFYDNWAITRNLD